MELLVDFAGVEADMLDRVGGKGLSLGLLSRAGFEVPDGFCVTTAGYRAAVADGLAPVLAPLGADQPADRLAELSAAARALVVASPVPDVIADAVRERYARLGDQVAVAVRSSATAEDLPDASFAGQQDSFLDVVGADAVLDAIRSCWASLWTERAVSYRAGIGLDQRAVALAVVVQRMVDAEVAGVMFTADPITGTRTHTVIDAAPGLGDAVVSGAVDPDHVRVDATTGMILERRVAGAPVIDSSRALCVTDEQIEQLVALGRRVQDFATIPQDIEWAIDTAGRLWLTQARPITTLYPTPPTTRPGLRVFLCMTLAQGLTRPITPMGLASYRRIAGAVAAVAGAPPTDAGAGPTGFVVAGQRQFVDITGVLQHPLARSLALRGAGVMEARTQTVLRQLIAEHRWPTTRTGSALPAVARVLWRSKLPFRVLAGLIEPALAYRGVERLERRLRHRLAVPDEATAEQRLDFVSDRLGTDTFMMMPRTIGYALGGFLALGLARRLLRGRVPAEAFQSVLRGLPHNVTTEMDLELWAVSARVRRGEVSIDQGLAGFRARYGHRAVAEIDIGMPRWSEEPEHLRGVIGNYLKLPDEELAPDRVFARGVAEGEAAVAALTARAAELGRLRGRLVGWALGRARALTGLRESPKNLLVLSLAALRTQLQRVGAACVAAGGIQAADDIFWLDLAEARRALTGEPLADLVADRRIGYASELRRRHIPRVLLSDGTEPEAGLASPEVEGALAGSPASAGLATGPARVILDPAAARLEPGEILVAPSTDPGWTPLFLTAAGLVMEMGGSNSHGAVVAREYGIPAVVGVRDATSLIHTGQTVTVDGGAGRVLTVDEPVGVVG